MPPTAVVSPLHSSGSISSTSSSVSIEEAGEISSSFGKAILRSAHKKAEMDGHHVPEPLLTENPNRFVLFPIQDNEVCTTTLDNQI